MNSQRLIVKKSDADFEKMKVAGACVAGMHAAVREAIEPGVTTRELDAIARSVLADHGCTSSFLGYGSPDNPFPGVLCTSLNSVIVHGMPDDTKLREGDIISVDAGAIFEGWHGDAAFTAPVGAVADEVATLLEVTERALWKGLEQAVAGNRLGDIGAAIEAEARPHDLGIVREYVGHGIGRQMHEAPSVPNRGTAGKGLRLKAGMSMAIEPMFNLGTADTEVLDDGWTVVTADRRLSAHFEHTVLITKDGTFVATLPEPRSVELGPVPVPSER